jgi:aspartate ammonia-lyase
MPASVGNTDALVRIEHDLLGSLAIPAQALSGIHTQRARSNFGLARRPVHRGLVHAFGAVKLACARANRAVGALGESKANAIEGACAEMMDGRLDAHVIVDALQGGAGTSTNMNVNEVIANRALQLLGEPLGRYDVIHPIEDVNRHQSTNDTYPTALRVAAIVGLNALERSLLKLVQAFQAQEHAMADVVKVARTEMQDAVLTTLGRSMGAYAEAFARDRWRTHKAVERLRVVNLGGTAIGTGLGAPRRYVFEVVDHLRTVTGLGLARAENLVDATQNADSFVEVSGMISACAANLVKACGDLRLLSSGPCAGLGEVSLTPVQAGSSIMPGKVNPVIPEAVTQAGLVALGHHHVLVHAAAMGNLELNAFMPAIADALLTMLDVLERACESLAGCVGTMTANRERCAAHVESSTAVLTALLDTLGYEKATEIAQASRASGRSIRQLVIEGGIMEEAAFDSLVAPERVTRLGSPEGTHT